MKQIFLTTAVISLFVAACNNGRSYNPPPQSSTTQQGFKLPETIIPNNGAQQPGANTQPVTTIQPVANTASTAGLNPEHGKPGHRCDIAVGAPLNSNPIQTTISPGQNATTSNPVTITPTTTASTTNATATSGLNPEHGKPGHRCDIAVGQPLNSKPTQPTTTGQKTNTTTSNPVSITPTTTATKTAPGMNPAHGQPGHRCDIAVGAPLSSKPPVTNVSQPTPLLPAPKNNQALPFPEKKVDSAQ